MNLLILILMVTFFTSLRGGPERRPIRSVPLIGVCMILAVGYLSQRVI